MIPSREQCYRFMDAYRMRDNIRNHSIMVEKVASLIARGLREEGFDVSLEKVCAGALMHDIAKTRCLETGEDHAALGARICRENGLEEIAAIVGEHVVLRSFDPREGIRGGEIVYYADKRVNHDKIVSLDERLEYLLRRYGRNNGTIQKRIRANIDLARRVEDKLFARLPFAPEDVETLIKERPGSREVDPFPWSAHPVSKG
ncbi:MAG: HDIG domain-containing protein [Deltaproteobacteria bacterium]|nr:HDIG domain-containing protein [Deltaproteobacteria bacterium]MBW2018182.1 HDIG domain-containing protein [Deltaproteobacteria bacterium]MBW2128719.1 HDIG domain-containing protein [Deltaproteobacteria bacterium]MBW2302399.1 HDIG domain-containing protein [Deltaproteobacteria bacterium]